MVLDFFQSQNLKIQQQWTYHDLLEYIKFQEKNIIPWENPIMEQLFQKFKWMEAKNLMSSFSGFQRAEIGLIKSNLLHTKQRYETTH